MTFVFKILCKVIRKKFYKENYSFTFAFVNG